MKISFLTSWFSVAGMMFSGVTVLPGTAVLYGSELLPKYEKYLETHAGDPVEGKQLFDQENRAGCIRCHGGDDAGKLVGPSLSSIGDKYDDKGLIQSIIQPSHTLTSCTLV